MTLLCKVGSRSKILRLHIQSLTKPTGVNGVFDLRLGIKYDETSAYKTRYLSSNASGESDARRQIKSLDKIEYDFQKLILARADLR